jgi:ferredoxin-NADP reductase/truncated hemoglobin YjbI
VPEGDFLAKIFFDKQTYPLREGESVLDALIRGGANIPFSCCKGSCQICMMQVEQGDPGPEGTKGLRPVAVEAKMFLPCCSRPSNDLSIKEADLSQLFMPMFLAEKEQLSDSIIKLSFELESQITWRPGQFVNIRRDDGVVRSYSIASILEEDYFLSIHVKRIEGGAMSPWLCDELEIGQTIQAQGPIGTCYYEPANKERNMLLLATGSGLAPIYNICRDALRQGHTGKLVLYHGSSTIDGLYLRDELKALADEHENFEYIACLTKEPNLPENVLRGRITDHAFKAHPDIPDWLVYICGIPDMVYEARYQAVLAGVSRIDIKADPFAYSHDYWPDDGAVLKSIKPDPELWEALESGPGLTKILTSFYTEAYNDQRIAPFFRRMTRDRAIQQQYAFLADIFEGKFRYFGLKPFNAHHWMIISDELFDYREVMIERHMRDYGLEEKFIRRWSALHEHFRRAIVKTSARGMIVDGKEQVIEQPEDVSLDFDTICNGCESEVLAGTTVHYVPQTGELFCAGCSAVPTPPPPPEAQAPA